MGQKQFKRSWKEEGAEAEGIVRTTSIDAPSSGRASICLCILEGGLRGAGLAGGPRSSGARKPQDALRGGSTVCPLCSRNPPLSVRATTDRTAPLSLPEDIHKGWNSAEQVREITGKNKELCGVYLNRESESEVSQLCTTLGDPVDCSPPGSSVHGILQARILGWVAIFFSRGSSQPQDRTQVSCISGRHFTIWATLSRELRPKQT